MPLPRFAKIQSEDETLNRVQDNAKKTLDALSDVLFMSGALLTVTLTGGAFTPVPHGLGRPVLGYLVLRRSANAVLWDRADSTDSHAFLYLQPSATVTVTLWVF